MPPTLAATIHLSPPLHAIFSKRHWKGRDAKAARLGVLRTTRVSAPTAILLLRARHLLTPPDRPPTLSEEVLVLGKRIGHPSPDAWLDDAEARRLLQEAQPEQNIPLAEKRELAEVALKDLCVHDWKTLSASGPPHPILHYLATKLTQRARELAEAHKRIRKAASQRVRELSVAPQLPPDLLAMLVLQPVVKR